MGSLPLIMIESSKSSPKNREVLGENGEDFFGSFDPKLLGGVEPECYFAIYWEESSNIY